MTDRRQPRRRRRVQLAVPGSSDKMMAKAAASRADHVFLDLEDAVAPNAKLEARQQIVAALRAHDWGGKTCCVRINDLGTRYAYRDIITVVEGAGRVLDTVMVPKVRIASDVRFVATLLDQIERDLELDRRIGIEVLIEEVEGLQNVEAIATASDRVEALILGVGDLSAAMRIDLDYAEGPTRPYPGDLWHYARFRLCMAARAAGVDAIDGPFPDFRDVDGFSAQCRSAAALGFDGKWAIHPSQIEPALAAFTPAMEDVIKARRLRDAFNEAQAKGLGSATIDGKMADIATLRIVKNVLDRAELYGM